MIDKFLTARTDNVIVQLFRYTFVGGVAFLVDIGSLSFLSRVCHIHYLLAAAIAFILGLTTNYVLSILWVFSTRKLHSRWHEFLIFAAIGVVGLGLNELIIWVLHGHCRIVLELSKIISTIVIYLYNFFLRKYMLYS